MIKAVFLDIDNTLTSRTTRAIPASALEAIDKARSRGTLVFVATGRHTGAPKERSVIDGVQLDGYVALNGQLCYLSDDTVIYKNVLDSHDVGELDRAANEMGFAYPVAEFNRAYLSAVNDDVIRFHGMMQIPILDVADTSGIEKREVFMLAPYAGEAEEREIMKRLRNSVSTRWSPETFDIIPRGGGKELGIEAVIRHFGIPRDECLTVGDGGNDVSMLRYAEHSAAMADGSDEAKAAAKIVIPSADQDGIYKLFKMYNLM